MSKEDKSPLDLSGLDFGPAWAKDKGPSRDYSKEVGPRGGRNSRGRGPRREGGGGGGDRRQSDRRGGGDRRDQRSGGGGGRRQDDRRQGDRRGDRRGNDRREYQPPTPPPAGFVAGVMPVEEGLDNLAREIKGGGRTYSVFDLARVVTGARERFNVTFDAPKGTTFFRCKSDGSIWLTKEECVQQFWRANLLGELYEEVIETVEPPKGNFTAVAKCGLSGEWLGPPNYHSYATEVARIHAERFSHMSLEDYKRRIRNESGEEAVQAWLDSQTQQKKYRPLTTEEILALRESRKAALASEKSAEDANSDAKAEDPGTAVASEAVPPKPPAAESDEADKSVSESSPAEHSPEAESTTEPDSQETSQETIAEEAPPEASAIAEEKSVQLLADRKDVERHFIDHHFKHLFAEVERAWVPANVPAKLLSPGLLTLLKDIVSEERRYPAKLTPILCRQLSGRHLAVFKWKKKLKAGPARPHAIPDDLTLAERPQILLTWILENSGKTLEDLWQACLPEGADEELKRAFYHDLHWLLNQGYVLLMADGSVHLAKGKASEQAAQNPPKKKKSKKEAPPANSDVKADSPADTATPEPEQTDPVASAPENDSAGEIAAESPTDSPSNGEKAGSESPNGDQRESQN